MAEAVDIDVIDFEDEYDKADPIDDVNLDESINELNRSIENRKSWKIGFVELNGHQ